MNQSRILRVIAAMLSADFVQAAVTRSYGSEHTVNTVWTQEMNFGHDSINLGVSVNNEDDIRRVSLYLGDNGQVFASLESV
jgi:hypothetical protein